MEEEVETCEDHYDDPEFHYNGTHIENLLHSLVLLIMWSKMIYVILLVLQISHALNYRSCTVLSSDPTEVQITAIFTTSLNSYNKTETSFWTYGFQ